MEKTALKIRYLVEAMDEEEISFHEQTMQNLVIETGLEGIESAKRNYNDTTLRQNVLREIELRKSALMVHTDGSIMEECTVKPRVSRKDTRSRKMCQSHRLS
jgi:hypothetical protein